MKLRHITIRTNDSAAMTRFWSDVIGLERCEPPPGGSTGMWFAVDGCPLIYVVENSVTALVMPKGLGAGVHISLAGGTYEDMLVRLQRNDVQFIEQDCFDEGLRQVMIPGPDGLLVERLCADRASVTATGVSLGQD